MGSNAFRAPIDRRLPSNHINEKTTGRLQPSPKAAAKSGGIKVPPSTTSSAGRVIDLGLAEDQFSGMNAVEPFGHYRPAHIDDTHDDDIRPVAAYRTPVDLHLIVSADSARYHMRRFGRG